MNFYPSVALGVLMQDPRYNVYRYYSQFEILAIRDFTDAKSNVFIPILTICDDCFANCNENVNA